MNSIDIIICVCFAVSIFFGLKDGVIRQLATLVGLVVAVILAKTFGEQVAQLLHIGGDYSTIWGYIIVLILSLIAVGVISKILRGLIKFAGLGFVDRLLGMALSLITCALIMSVIFSVVDTFNVVSKESRESSILYAPVVSTSSYLLPALVWVESQIPSAE